MSGTGNMVHLSTAQLIAKFGHHKFLAGEKPDGAPKGSHYPCRKCGASKKHSAHRSPEEGDAKNVPEAVADDKHVAVKCPTCRGHGTVLIPLAVIQRAALKMGDRAP